MRYVSPRGETPPMAFQDAVITGLAPDGGLLVPASIPDVSGKLSAWKNLGFVDLAAEVMGCFIDDIPREDLNSLVKRSYQSFDHIEIAPLVDLDEFQVLELFHGPTLAFKDVALQFLGQLFDYTLGNRGGRLNILGATSGDTGSAAIAGVRGKANVNIGVMFPRGRVSALQQLQMTTIADANVHCLSIDGSFDDCQSIMKRAFADLPFKTRHDLGAVNSVNWARVLAQVVYYVYLSLRCDEGDGVDVSVPTGNFGNIFAAYIARSMGAPLGRLLLGTNENNILSVFFNSGDYRRGEVHHTISPSMDIQVASNFERFLYFGMQEDGARCAEFMREFADQGSASVPASMLQDQPITATAVDTAATLATIQRIHKAHGYVLDPHTAVGVAAAEALVPRASRKRPLVCIATAHPAKFPDAIQDALPGVHATHQRLEALKSLPERLVELPATDVAVRDYVEANLV